MLVTEMTDQVSHREWGSMYSDEQVESLAMARVPDEPEEQVVYLETMLSVSELEAMYKLEAVCIPTHAFDSPRGG